MSDPQQDALLSGDFSEDRKDDLNAPIGWRGLPEFTRVERDTRLVLTFDTPEERDELIAKLGLILSKKTGTTWSAWWPPRERDDLAALRFDFDADEQGEDEGERPEQPEPDELGGQPPAEPDDERDETSDAVRERPIWHLPVNGPDDRQPPASDGSGTPHAHPVRGRQSEQPWPEHLGHQIALAWSPDGTIVGAVCRTCDTELPPPDSVVDVGAGPGAADAPEAAATAVQANESTEEVER
jgi:hypothetical protein